MKQAKLIVKIAEKFSINPSLVASIVYVESSGRSLSARYEKDYRWTTNTKEHALRQGITEATEKELQKFSWGLMQVMGGTARWLGYQGFLPQLLEPSIGLHWGCEYLQKMINTHKDMNMAIAAYNAGSVTIEDGKFKNQEYVDKVIKIYKELEGKGVPSV